MIGAQARLSPLNFRGLLATAGLTPQGDMAAKPAHARHRAVIECWRCAECLQVYDWEDEAEECCADPAPAQGSEPACPVCAQQSLSHRHAADCCLWKDPTQTQRYAIADAVEAGQSWLEAIGLE